MINKDSIENGIYSDLIFVNLRINFVRNIIVNRVLHVLRQHTSKPLLIEGVIVEDLYKYVQHSLVLIRIEPKFENLVLLSGRVVLAISDIVLVLDDVVEDLFDKSKRVLEDNIGELRAAKDSLLHVFQSNILEAKNLLSVMVSDHCSRHSSNFALHYIL